MSVLTVRPSSWAWLHDRLLACSEGFRRLGPVPRFGIDMHIIPAVWSSPERVIRSQGTISAGIVMTEAEARVQQGSRDAMPSQGCSQEPAASELLLEPLEEVGWRV